MKTKLTEKQKQNLKNKHIPQNEVAYIVTDNCFWDTNPPENYNIYDPKRKPHGIELVDVKTGTVVMLKSGSVIKIIKAK